MASMSFRELTRLLADNGCYYLRDAKRGGHEYWFSPITKLKFSVPKRLKGEGTLQKILKASGLQLVRILQGEKQILGNNQDQQSRIDHTIGGLYHMDAKGTITGDLNSYIRDYDNKV